MHSHGKGFSRSRYVSDAPGVKQHATAATKNTLPHILFSRRVACSPAELSRPAVYAQLGRFVPPLAGRVRSGGRAIRGRSVGLDFQFTKVNYLYSADGNFCHFCGKIIERLVR